MQFYLSSTINDLLVLLSKLAILLAENQVNFIPYILGYIDNDNVQHTNSFQIIEPSPFHSHQPAPIQPLKSHPTPQHSPQTTANQAAFTRAVPFQGPTNVRATPTVNAASNDWIPISQPIGSPITTSYSQLSTSRPTSSNGPIFEDTAVNFDPFTFNNGNSI
jgi:hypothetical protein